MKYYALLYTLADDYLARRGAYRDEHLRLAREAQRRGELLLAGAFADPADRALLVFRGTDGSAAEEFARQDPYVAAGIVTRWEVRPWTVVVGDEPVLMSMSTGQFRFSYFTADYDSTVAFYRDGLDLPVLESWDRAADDRGTLFGAASGIIEILTRPVGAGSSHFWDERLPQGAFMVVEVKDVDERYRRAVERRLPIQQALADQEWGHRSFCLREPNGLTVYFFTPIRRG